MNSILNKSGKFWFEEDKENTFNGKIIKENDNFLLETDIPGILDGEGENYGNIIIRKIDNIPATFYKCYRALDFFV